MANFKSRQLRRLENKQNSRVWNFISAPALHPMEVRINVDKPGTAPGLLFVAPYTSFEAPMIGQTGALIMDQSGNPVWFRPLKDRFVQNTDFRVQVYQGKPVLTMWQGTISGTQTAEPELPDGDPEPGAFFQIMDQSYRIMKQIKALKGFTADVHEFTITERNTALYTAVKQVPANLTQYGGPEDGAFDNYSVQEVDIETGELLFYWNVLAHVDPADSMLPASSSVSTNNIWDCYHVNSVEEGPDCTLLISMRNMWAIYNVDKKTGNIIWQLGGKQSSFRIESNAGFSWQHDARYRGRNRISLFDDACCGSSSSPPQGPARGLILRLDFQEMTASEDRTYYHDPLLFVQSQGNVQQQPNKNQLIGWGQASYLSEFSYPGNYERDPAVNFLYDMRYPGQNISYRAFKNQWIGLPYYPPRIAIETFYEISFIYASWNGSTETVAWQVLAGASCMTMRVIEDYVPRTGFETKICVKSCETCYQVNALDKNDHVIGSSRIVCACR
jgi:Arylsulfotransferase (ASST).